MSGCRAMQMGSTPSRSSGPRARVGFFPAFFNLSETGRMIHIAKAAARRAGAPPHPSTEAWWGRFLMIPQGTIRYTVPSRDTIYSSPRASSPNDATLLIVPNSAV